MADIAELSNRIDALEQKMDRILALLEGPSGALQPRDQEAEEALARIAQLAPELEYAAQIVAAGPILLEEGLEALRESVGPHDDALQLEAAKRLALAATARRNLEAATGMAEQVPALASGVTAAGQALTELQQVHGTAVAESVREAVLKLGDPEVIATLGRLAELAPQLEYAAHAAAAGPELLEDTLVWLRELGGPDPLDVLLEIRPKLERAVKLLDILPDDTVLAQLESFLQHSGELADSAPKLLSLLDKVDVDAATEVLEFIHDIETLSIVRAAQGAISEAASAPPRHVGLWGLLSALNDPDVQRTVGVGVTASKAFAQRLKSLPLPESK